MPLPYQQAIALFCVGTLMFAERQISLKPEIGTSVLLGRACPANAMDERRDLAVRYLPSGRLWLNEVALDEEHLRPKLRQELTPRLERVVWVAADERVTYGEVVSLISKLDQDTPNLHVALATKAQVGVVDPTDSRYQESQRDTRLGVGTLCVY